MSEEQMEEKLETQENKVLIVLGVFLGVIWISFLVINFTVEGLPGFVYIIYGVINIGTLIVYFKIQRKEKIKKWLK